MAPHPPSAGPQSYYAVDASDSHHTDEQPHLPPPPPLRSRRLSSSRLLEDGADLKEAFESKSWVAGGLAVAATAADTAAAVMDPLGEALSAGVGWIIEHLSPLKDWLNELAGDSDAVAAAASTWTNIGTKLNSCAGELEAVCSSRLAGQESLAVATFKTLQAGSASHLRMTGEVAGAISGGLTLASMIVRMVHDMVRDAIADVIGKLTSKAAIMAVSLGTAAPWAVSSVAADVSSWVARLSKEVADVVLSSKNLKKLLDKAENLFSRLGKKWESFKASRAEKKAAKKKAAETPADDTKNADNATDAATDGAKSTSHATDTATDGAKGAASAAGAAATSTKHASHATDAAADGAKSANRATDAAADGAKSTGNAADAAADGAKGADDAADAAGDAADGARGADDAADAAVDGSRGADGSADGPSFDERHRPEVTQSITVNKGDDLYPGKMTPFAQKPDITLEPNTHYRVERPGGVHSDYYTDASGNVTHVECHSKWETGYLNQDLQNPLPNATYSVDGKFHYVTDEHARTVRMEVDGEMTPKPKDVAEVRSPHTQRQINAYGNDLPGEHNGGHMAGTQFYGPPEKINVVAMLKEVNQNFPDSGFNSYHVLETDIAKNPGNYQNFVVDFDYRDPVGPELTRTERVPTDFRATWTDAEGVPRREKFVNHH